MVMERVCAYDKQQAIVLNVAMIKTCVIWMDYVELNQQSRKLVLSHKTIKLAIMLT
ncbi:Hypothetical predicted protein [Mytilus galloprovincialis]|uniref:Uncharacterized protein n=1 Tax=Mytilus galloprovincialis TaxID=29158 RepID=A0A8B6FPN4_MYTGA|nr:Hypothetical predicted protein [Mytilus galloprovincialis]